MCIHMYIYRNIYNIYIDKKLKSTILPPPQISCGIDPMGCMDYIVNLSSLKALVAVQPQRPEPYLLGSTVRRPRVKPVPRGVSVSEGDLCSNPCHWARRA